MDALLLIGKVIGVLLLITVSVAGIIALALGAPDDGGRDE